MALSRKFRRIALLLVAIEIVNLAAVLLAEGEFIFLGMLFINGVACVFAIATQKFWSYPQSAKKPTTQLITPGSVGMAIFLGLGFAFDDLMLGSSDLQQPWFWGMVVGNFTLGLLGIAIARYRTFRREQKSSSLRESEDQ